MRDQYMNTAMQSRIVMVRRLLPLGLADGDMLMQNSLRTRYATGRRNTGPMRRNLVDQLRTKLHGLGPC